MYKNIPSKWYTLEYVIKLNGVESTVLTKLSDLHLNLPFSLISTIGSRILFLLNDINKLFYES